jgi:O-methyltransferase involved in polyketide biosynthesis
MQNEKLKIPEISETLFIPLAVRAYETLRVNGVIRDDKAVEFLNRADTSKFIVDGGSISTLGILARTKIIDEEISKILSSVSKAVIVNLGAGLDTRYNRISRGEVEWYDLDLPETIELRKQFVGESDIHFIAKSILDECWTDEVRTEEGDAVIIIAEGLLMYFEEKDVQKVFQKISEAFPKADIFLDVVHPFFINKGISSKFLWGIDSAKNLEKLDSHIELVKSWSMGSLLKERQPWLLRILNILPSTRKRSQIIHLKVKERDYIK